MMKISLLIDISELTVINKAMSTLDSINFYSTPKHLRSSVDICIELREYLLKKAIDKRRSEKAFKLKLTYYKADALCRYLYEFHASFAYPAGSYEKHVIRTIHSELHQKLN